MSGSTCSWNNCPRCVTLRAPRPPAAPCAARGHGPCGRTDRCPAEVRRQQACAVRLLRQVSPSQEPSSTAWSREVTGARDLRRSGAGRSAPTPCAPAWDAIPANLSWRRNWASTCVACNCCWEIFHLDYRQPAVGMTTPTGPGGRSLCEYLPKLGRDSAVPLSALGNEAFAGARESQLPEKERQVLALYYEELTMAALGVGESQVSRIAWWCNPIQAAARRTGRWQRTPGPRNCSRGCGRSMMKLREIFVVAPGLAPWVAGLHHYAAEGGEKDA